MRWTVMQANVSMEKSLESTQVLPLTLTKFIGQLIRSISSSELDPTENPWTSFEHSGQ